MRSNYLSTLVLMSIVSFPLLSEESLPKKTLAIVYEETKTSDALFHTAFTHFKKVVGSGELKSAELGTAKIFGEVIDIQTATDRISTALHEREAALWVIRNSIEADNLPYSGRFSILGTNIMFGDKSLGYTINPYRGCYQHDYLAKGLEQSGFTIVDANASPDITMTIGIDACMTENEYKAYIQKNTSLKIKNNTTTANTNNSNIGNDLIRSGSSAQLGTPTGGGNAGIAVAGVGLALNMVNWLTAKSPQERDMTRYHVKFEGKNKTPLEFYPMGLSINTHKEGAPIYIRSYEEGEKYLFVTFIAWNAIDSGFSEKLPPYLLEKNITKATEMMVNDKK
jgi:hypothetical protein